MMRKLLKIDEFVDQNCSFLDNSSIDFIKLDNNKFLLKKILMKSSLIKKFNLTFNYSFQKEQKNFLEKIQNKEKFFEKTKLTETIFYHRDNLSMIRLLELNFFQF